jgi:hypothetical protein
VWSGNPSQGCSCLARIPRDVVTSAWRSELERGAVRADSFFRFNWGGGAWITYGRKDGRVGGIYCPSHSAARDERSRVADSCHDETACELAVSG